VFQDLCADGKPQQLTGMQKFGSAVSVFSRPSIPRLLSRAKFALGRGRMGSYVVKADCGE
jgi:hypothetical protein